MTNTPSPATVARAALRSRRSQVVTAVFTLAATSVVSTINPVLVKYVFNDALFGPTGLNLRLVVVFAVLMVVVAGAAAGLGIAGAVICERIAQSFVQETRDDLFDRLLSAPLDALRSKKLGEITARFMSDLLTIESSLTSAGTSLVAGVILLLVSVAAMLLLSPVLTVVTIAMTPVFIALTRAVAARRRVVAERVQEQLGLMSVVVQETLSSSGIIHTRLYGRTSETRVAYRRLTEAIYRDRVRQALLGARLDAAVGVLFSVFPALVYVGSGLALRWGYSVQVGTVVAFTAVQLRFFGPLGLVTQLWTELVSAAPAMQRVLEFVPPGAFDEVSEDQPGPAELAGAAPEVVLRDVEYCYPGVEPGGPESPGWQGSIGVPGGHFLVVMGSTGSGKSTLALLIAGLVKPTAGDIRIGAGGPSPSRVGLVTQRPHLINSSVQRNLTYGRSAATRDLVEEAVAVVGLSDRIAAMQDGYDTVLGQEGGLLSGGEAQRIAVARLLVADPPVMIFDEATSALDPVTELEVWTRLRARLAQHTVIAITHNPALARQADLVVFFEDGRIVGRGTHEVLLASCEGYRKMTLAE